jgi:thiosulfate dehydrogenase [quinone] large subunit
MKTSSIAVIVVAALLGLLLGAAMGDLWWALLLGAVSAVAAWLTVREYERGEPGGVRDWRVDDPPVARFLFSDVRSAALWLPIRLFVGWQWLNSGWGKLGNPAWMDTGEALRGFWQGAVAIPETGRAPITYEWWRGFLQFMLDNQAYTWFSKVIAFGELAVGLGLITGTLVGIAAFGGAFMNLAFLLSGTASSNPILLFLQVFLVLAWKVAGWIGLDRWLLPLLGTPWRPGSMFRRGGVEGPPGPSPGTVAPR